MPGVKTSKEYAPIGRKTNWHAYSLQQLTPEKFAKVTNEILKGNFRLLITKPDKNK